MKQLIGYQGKEVQLQLFPEETKKLSKEVASFSDPAFASNKTLPVHRWVPWIAGFSSDFVRQALEKHLERKGTVLDPFAGVGTTLIESIRLGHDAIGFEINPYAALACRIKLNARLIDAALLKTEISKCSEFYRGKTMVDYVPRSLPPEGFHTRDDFYSPKVLRKVLIIQDFITTIDDINIRDLFRLAFAATMVRYSNYSYEPSLTRRVSSGKSEILDFPVWETILCKLAEIAEDVTWLQSHVSDQTLCTSVTNDSFFNYKQYLEPQSVDLIVTSPPYLNNYHYNRNTRPQMYWLGYAEKPKDLHSLEMANFGKYWQTVREQEYLSLDFSLPDTNIEQIIELLRSINPEKKIYGGNGWANYAASYFNDCRKLAMGIHYCLKPGGTALIVIGNSILQGITIPTDQYFAKIAEAEGLELVEIHIPRATRVGNSIIQSSVRAVKAEKAHKLYEAVVELRKS